MVFVNIIVMCNQNYENDNRIGTIKRTLSPLKQFIVLYRSIKKNWNFPYRISVVHTIDFRGNDMDIIKSLDVDIFKVDPDMPGYKEFQHRCKCGCLCIEPKNIGTHRLILDIDMIALKNPNFDYDVDFQAMYAGPIVYDDDTVKYICNRFGYDYIKIPKNIRFLCIAYHLNNKKDLYPHFNGGAILIKENLTKKLAELFRPSLILGIRKGWKDYNKVQHSHIHYSGQFCMSLSLITLSKKWKPFEPGFNYLLKMYDVNKYGKNNISLLHYCGIGAQEKAQILFKDYFNVLNDYNF